MAPGHYKMMNYARERLIIKFGGGFIENITFACVRGQVLAYQNRDILEQVLQRLPRVIFGLEALPMYLEVNIAVVVLAPTYEFMHVKLLTIVHGGARQAFGQVKRHVAETLYA